MTIIEREKTEGQTIHSFIHLLVEMGAKHADAGVAPEELSTQNDSWCWKIGWFSRSNRTVLGVAKKRKGWRKKSIENSACQLENIAQQRDVFSGCQRANE